MQIFKKAWSGFLPGSMTVKVDPLFMALSTRAVSRRAHKRLPAQNLTPGRVRAASGCGPRGRAGPGVYSISCAAMPMPLSATMMTAFAPCRRAAMVTLPPECVAGEKNRNLLIRNLQGKVFSYPLGEEDVKNRSAVSLPTRSIAAWGSEI